MRPDRRNVGELEVAKDGDNIVLERVVAETLTSEQATALIAEYNDEKAKLTDAYNQKIVNLDKEMAQITAAMA